MDLGLKGKRTIVTGGSRGIGRCCALALAHEGARVCITARSQGRLDEVIDEINGAGGEGYSVAVDLTSLESCQKVVSETVEHFGGVDILVNCAGAARGGDILDLPTELIDDALSLKKLQLSAYVATCDPAHDRERVGTYHQCRRRCGNKPYQWKYPGKPC